MVYWISIYIYSKYGHLVTVTEKAEASITFEVDSSLLKGSNGVFKRWFGKIQRVIEKEVMLPEDVIIKYGGRKWYLH